MSAWLLSNTIPERTCVSWTVVIGGYARVGEVENGP